MQQRTMEQCTDQRTGHADGYKDKTLANDLEFFISRGIYSTGISCDVRQDSFWETIIIRRQGRVQ